MSDGRRGSPTERPAREPGAPEEKEPQTFLFADLAGFTALTEAHGDEEAADLAQSFFAEIRALLAEHCASEVKTIGDAMMIHCHHPPRAVELGLAVVDRFASSLDFPAVRVGIHSGPAVRRGHDWFGSAVNVAARVAGTATAGEVLLTEATVEACDWLGGIELESEGEQRFRNLPRPVRVYRARRSGEERPGLPIDPVCRMAVDPDRVAGSLSYGGRVYHFCSLRCAAAFSADPDTYLGEEP
jgi:adenylate cyclase